MVFTATVRDPAGARRTVSREADSLDSFMAALRAERYVVLSVEESPGGDALPPRWHPAWLKPMTGFDVEMGLRQLASMLKSGVALLSALATVEEQAPCPRAAVAWRKVRESVFAGGSFAGALEHQAKRFGEITVRLADVGERSGELEHALTRAADQMESRRNLRTAVVNALVYPLVTVLMAVGVSAYLVVAVIPKLAEFLKDGGVELPGMTMMLMNFADFVKANGLVILGWFVAAVAAWFGARYFSVRAREMEDLFMLRIPVTGRILRLSGTALFARAMQIMVESGVTLLDALDVSCRLMSNLRYKRRVMAARDGVMRGGSLADSLRPAREFMPMLARMSAVGEVTGSLSEAFGEVARFHEMLLAIAIKRFGMLIEPVMICVTGGIVGFVYIAFFMALFAIAGAA